MIKADITQLYAGVSLYPHQNIFEILINDLEVLRFWCIYDVLFGAKMQPKALRV